MATYTNHKNITKKLSLVEKLEALTEEAVYLQIEIDRPKKQTEARHNEHTFGERYRLMSYDEKEQIQRRRCYRCVGFSSENIESFASFFGMCECVWQRYVARTYLPYDSLDMNYRKDDRYFEIARKALKKMKILREKMTDIAYKIENNEKRRKCVEYEKASYFVGDAEVHRRLQEREIQAVKNQKKMDTMDRFPKKKKKHRGKGRKQSTI
jgi:hypothetical protein